MIDFEIERIIPLCEKFGVNIDEEAKKRLNLYGNLLISWNEKINLTALTEPKEVLFKHFYDSILLLKAVSIPKGAKTVDVGTGAGFPGMVIKIVRTDLEVTLLDSLNKRLVFLNDVIEKTGLSGVKTVHIRAEDAGKSPDFREKFDIAAARAVAAMPKLLEYCVPLVSKNGLFVAMKGPSVFEEITASGNLCRDLGCKEPEIITETLTGEEERIFCIYKKISQTSPKYPRKPKKTPKQPN